MIKVSKWLLKNPFKHSLWGIIRALTWKNRLYIDWCELWDVAFRFPPPSFSWQEGSTVSQRWDNSCVMRFMSERWNLVKYLPQSRVPRRIWRSTFYCQICIFSHRQQGEKLNCGQLTHTNGRNARGAVQWSRSAPAAFLNLCNRGWRGSLEKLVWGQRGSRLPLDSTAWALMSRRMIRRLDGGMSAELWQTRQLTADTLGVVGGCGGVEPVRNPIWPARNHSSGPTWFLTILTGCVCGRLSLFPQLIYCVVDVFSNYL